MLERAGQFLDLHQMRCGIAGLAMIRPAPAARSRALLADSADLHYIQPWA